MKTAIRSFLKNPGFNMLVIFALALGLGANTAVFSVVNGVLLKPLPFPEAENLVIVRDTKLPQFPEFSVSPGNFLDRQAQSTGFESMGAWSTNRFNLLEGAEPEALTGVLVTASLLPTIRVNPMLGRGFLPDDDQEGKAGVVILSHRLWQRRFGSDPAIVGRAITLNARSYTVIGVMPPRQSFPNDTIDIWAPIAFNAAMRGNHGSHYLGMIGRLKPGVSLEQAHAELETIARRLEAAYPNTNTGWGVKTAFLMDSAVGRVRTTLLVLWAAVGFVLLIACANVANLLLVRSSTRQREMAIRTAIGASRWQVMRQLLTESLVLSCAGGAAGLLLAYWGIQALITLAPQVLPRTSEIGFDLSVVIFSLLVSVATGLIFGLAPALQASKPNLTDALKESGRGAAGSVGRRRIRHALVVAEVALSLILLVGAGLLIRSFMRLQNVNPGFDPENALAVSLALPSLKYPGGDERRQFVDRALQEIQSLPGVDSVGVSHSLPFTSDYVVGVVFEGRPEKAGEDISTNYYSISPDYFKAMGIPVKRGRVFTAADTKDSPRVTVISETFAGRFYPNEDPIGKRIRLTQGPDAWREIVGVVGDVKQYGLDSESPFQAYEPFSHMPFSGVTLVVRTAADPETFAASVRSRILTVDREQPVQTVRALDQVLSESIGAQRFSSSVLTALAGVALLLATVGLYGVLAYLVTQRIHEIGLRMALGASRASVFMLVVGQGMLLTMAGVAAGLAGAFALTRLMSTMLYEISVTDKLTFAGIPAILMVVALFACYVPARRAMKIDPMVALRHE